ncbi:MAG: ABC transporter permease subunit [bacterium]|nr:ABC transporter permease subunit [bacterium]
MRRKKTVMHHIYPSKRHVFTTLAFIVVPFLFLLSFSRIAHISGAELFVDVFVSLARLLAAYLIAVFLAWILAVSFYRGRRSIVALPLFDVLQSFPTFAVLPLISYFFRPANGTIIFFLVLTILWPILFSIIGSLKLIKRDWEEVVAVSGVAGVDYVRFFLWPVSLPGLITGSIIGVGDGWGALVATEIIVNARHGLGDFFGTFSHNPEITIFGILGLLIIVFCINTLVWLPLLEKGHLSMEE